MDSKTLKALSKLDRKLGHLISKVPFTFEIQEQLSPYESLFRAIVYQQLTGKAAGTILGRVQDLYPKRRIPKPEEVLETPDEKLRGAGLSRAKTAAIKDLAAKAIEGVVPTAREIVRLSDEEVVERLTSIRGVGVWTVQMMLIFKLGRPDVWPVTDYGVRKGFALLFKHRELPTPKELILLGERFAPHRSTLAWYMWRAVEFFPSPRRPTSSSQKARGKPSPSKGSRRKRR
jgi:3-methyladenine DNA glycosylase/8-oxoguanine DNA glycosylase